MSVVTITPRLVNYNAFFPTNTTIFIIWGYFIPFFANTPGIYHPILSTYSYRIVIFYLYFVFLIKNRIAIIDFIDTKPPLVCKKTDSDTVQHPRNLVFYKSKAKNTKKCSFYVLKENLIHYILLSNKQNNHYILCFSKIVRKQKWLGQKSKQKFRLFRHLTRC